MPEYKGLSLGHEDASLICEGLRVQAYSIRVQRHEGTSLEHEPRVQGFEGKRLMPWKSINNVDHARCCHL